MTFIKFARKPSVDCGIDNNESMKNEYSQYSILMNGNENIKENLDKYDKCMKDNHNDRTMCLSQRIKLLKHLSDPYSIFR